jgi:monothiol glutaredoxin
VAGCPSNIHAFDTQVVLLSDEMSVVQIAFGFLYALFSRTMITADAVTAFIRQVFPDADVTVIDKTGTQDHLIVRVTSGGFLGKNLLDRHRLVYQAPGRSDERRTYPCSGDYSQDTGRSEHIEEGQMADPIEDEIQQEIKANKILIYGKGTKAMPMCGFTRETMHFFEKYGYPYELIDVLSQPAKREALTKLTNWPTLPKVFIDGQFYGDTDILDPMEAKGEVMPLLKKAFGAE